MCVTIKYRDAAGRVHETVVAALRELVSARKAELRSQGFTIMM